jgi:hypothetical protein
VVSGFAVWPRDHARVSQGEFVATHCSDPSSVARCVTKACRGELNGLAVHADVGDVPAGRRDVLTDVEARGDSDGLDRDVDTSIVANRWRRSRYSRRLAPRPRLLRARECGPRPRSGDRPSRCADSSDRMHQVEIVCCGIASTPQWSRPRRLVFTAAKPSLAGCSAILSRRIATRSCRARGSVLRQGTPPR